MVSDGSVDCFALDFLLAALLPGLLFDAICTIAPTSNGWWLRSTAMPRWTSSSARCLLPLTSTGSVPAAACGRGQRFEGEVGAVTSSGDRRRGREPVASTASLRRAYDGVSGHRSGHDGQRGQERQRDDTSPPPHFPAHRGCERTCEAVVGVSDEAASVGPRSTGVAEVSGLGSRAMSGAGSGSPREVEVWLAGQVRRGRTRDVDPRTLER